MVRSVLPSPASFARSPYGGEAGIVTAALAGPAKPLRRDPAQRMRERVGAARASLPKPPRKNPVMGQPSTDYHRGQPGAAPGQEGGWQHNAAQRPGTRA